MYKSKLINTIDILIKIFIVLFLGISIWFIGMKNTLESPETHDIRTLWFIAFILLVLIIIKFVFRKSK